MVLNQLIKKPIGGKLASSLLSEAYGTFFLTFVVSVAPKTAGVLAPICIGGTLVALVFSHRFIGGAQFNPAVTLGVFCLGLMTVGEAVAYVIVQMLSGFVGALMGSAVLKGFQVDAIVGGPIPAMVADSTPASIGGTFAAEFVFTFLLVMTVLLVNASRNQDNHFYGLCIGLTVVAGAGTVGSISGGGFNPAVVTGTQVMSCIQGDCAPIKWCWLYYLANTVGSLVAATLYLLMHGPPEYRVPSEMTESSPKTLSDIMGQAARQYAAGGEVDLAVGTMPSPGRSAALN